MRKARALLALVGVLALAGCAGAYVAGDTGAHHRSSGEATRP